MAEDGPRWQTIDPQHRGNGCEHDRHFDSAVHQATMCLRCGVAIESISAAVLDLVAARRRRAKSDDG